MTEVCYREEDKMSTVAATRSKTYDIVYIAVFAVIMAICSVYIADIWCFYCRRDSRRKKRNTFCSCIYSSRSHRCAGICRIFRWNRCSCRNDRWVYHRISFLCTCNVGNGKTSWQKSSDADCFYDRRIDCLLCIWYCMVYDRLQQSKRSCWSGNRSWMVRDSVHHSGYYQNRTCLWTFQKAS